MNFIPGLELSCAFYHEAVRPILDESFPDLPHAAALIGSGSEVLGFDDAMSADHHWGPRVMLFLDETNHRQVADAIRATLRQRLPPEFRGYPTNFSNPNPDDNGVQLLQPIDSGPVNHRVDLLTVRGFFRDYLNVDVERPLEPADWLTLPQQKLRTVTAGAVYHDDIGLEAIRARLAWYPHDVWLYLLAATWTRIEEEEHLMGRAGMVGDEIGSSLIGSRLVRDLMRLCFLMERQYAPYPKWFGTAFQQLACAEQLTPHLQAALAATDWQTREEHLVVAYEAVAALHNRLGLTDPMPTTATNFHGRPFRAMAFHGFAEALLNCITDPVVREIARRPLLGNVDLVSDNIDLLEATSLRPQLRTLYR